MQPVLLLLFESAPTHRWAQQHTVVVVVVYVGAFAVLRTDAMLALFAVVVVGLVVWAMNRPIRCGMFAWYVVVAIVVVAVAVGNVAVTVWPSGYKVADIVVVLISVLPLLLLPLA